MTNTNEAIMNTEEVTAEEVATEVKVPLHKKALNFVAKHKKAIAIGAVAVGCVAAAIAGVKMHKGNPAEAVDDLADAADAVTDAVEEVVDITNF
jgi:hypothetical protein